jgi:hypothetical protein
MAYELVQNGNTQFAIDWDVMRRLVKSYYTSYHQYDSGREVTLSDSQWYNPLSWSLPEVSHVEVDWDAVRARTEADTAADLRDLRAEAASNAPRVARRIESLIEATNRNKELFVEWMGTVQTQNTESISKAVDDYESNIEIAKMVRDNSARGLMVGASVMTGGGAVAALGGASFFKGFCKFQDTDSVGAGVMEGAGSFIFAYVKLGKSFSFKQDMVLAFVQAPYEATTELVAGKTLSEAAVSGAVKLTGPAVDRLFKLGPSKTLFDKLAVPISITYGGDNKASELLTGFGKSAVKEGIKSGTKAVLLGSNGASQGDEAGAGTRRSGQLVREATLSNKFLLYLAFVNMTKGIGHGW